MNDDSDQEVVFYAEDEILTRKQLVQILERIGFEVRAFENGQDLWDALQNVLETSERLPDLIITDNQMPEMTGLDLLRELEGAGEPLSGIPRLMVSGDDVEKDAAQLGTVFLRKPGNLPSLKAAIQTALEGNK